MKKMTGIFLGCLITSVSLAQEAHSPEELAQFVQKAIQTKNTGSLNKLIHPSASSDSINGYKELVASYHNAADLKVYAVPKDNTEAVHQFLALTGVNPLDERVKRIESFGSNFAVKPLGDLVVSGKRLELRSDSVSSAMYGKQDRRYVIVFANRK